MKREKLPGSRQALLACGYLDINTARSRLTLNPGDGFFYTYPRWGSVGWGARFEIEDSTVVEFAGELDSYARPLEMMMPGADKGTGTFIFRALKRGETKVTVWRDFRGEYKGELKSVEVMVE